MDKIKFLLFDWGDTLMVDFPEYKGAMITWPKIEAVQGVNETLPLLATYYTCAVASNAGDSNSELMKQAFEKINLIQYFSLFITSKELSANKPEKTFFLGAACKLNAEPNNICMIGNDYVKDIVGAKNVGMKTILLSSENGEYPLADVIISSFYQLKEILIDSAL